MFSHPFPKQCAFSVLSTDAELVPDNEIQRLAQGFKHAGRRHQFCAGRVAAKKALGQALGTQGQGTQYSVGIKNQRPVWPAGMVGSISHCEGWAVCLVGKPGFGVKSVGLDIENLNREYSAKLQNKILNIAEQRLWQHQLQEDPQQLIRLACCKEAVYKCWSLATHQPLFWQQIQVLELTANAFTATTFTATTFTAMQTTTKRIWHGYFQQVQNFGLAAVLWVKAT